MVRNKKTGQSNRQRFVMPQRGQTGGQRDGQEGVLRLFIQTLSSETNTIALADVMAYCKYRCPDAMLTFGPATGGGVNVRAGNFQGEYVCAIEDCDCDETHAKKNSI